MTTMTQLALVIMGWCALGIRVLVGVLGVFTEGGGQKRKTFDDEVREANNLRHLIIRTFHFILF